MIGVKRWVKNLPSTEELKNCNAGANISWSSSSSEEDNSCAKKRCKFIAPSSIKKCKQWLKQISSSDTYFDYTSRTAKILKLTPDSKLNSSVTFEEVNSDDSPVLNTLNDREMSPVLTHRNEEHSVELSPVLGKRKAIKMMKIKHKTKVDELRLCEPQKGSPIEEDSPDLFISQSSQKIIEDSPEKTIQIVQNSSPEKVIQSQCSILEKLDSELSESPDIEDSLKDMYPPTFKIENNSSSQSCSIINLDSSTKITSSKSSTEKQHRPIRFPKRRKTKKGPLCSQLFKIFKAQEAKLTFWQHELYLEKLKKENNILFKNNMTSEENVKDIKENLSSLCKTDCTASENAISFYVRKMWKEFGVKFYECCYFDFDQSIPDTCEENETLKTKSISNEISETENKFILIIGFNAACDNNLVTNVFYKFYPPYSIKTISYDSSIVNCYFNVFKLLNCR